MLTLLQCFQCSLRCYTHGLRWVCFNLESNAAVVSLRLEGSTPKTCRQQPFQRCSSKMMIINIKAGQHVL